MFMICWTENGINTWEIIDGKDEMQVFVSDKIEELQINTDEIIVFSMDNEIR